MVRKDVRFSGVDVPKSEAGLLCARGPFVRRAKQSTCSVFPRLSNAEVAEPQLLGVKKALRETSTQSLLHVQSLGGALRQLFVLEARFDLLHR